MADARTGFRRSKNGIFYWFHDKRGVANFVGPVASLQPVADNEFVLKTNSGTCHRVVVDFRAIVEYRSLGGSVEPRQPGPSANDNRKLVAKATRRDPKPISDLEERRTLRNMPNPHWLGKGDSIVAGMWKLTAPLAWFSNGSSQIEEASCVDLQLPVMEPMPEPPGALGYWPEYSRMAPHQRGNYLSWLAGGRTTDLQDIGYAFVYFYGLERRLLVDNRDINAITAEVVRLLNRYTFSGSFTGYLSRFLAFVIARTGLDKLREEWFNHIFDESPIQPGEEILALALAWFVQKNRPLSERWAFRMAQQHPQSSRSGAASAAPEQFAALFGMKYRERFGDGMALKQAVRHRTISYDQPASPSLLAMRSRGKFASSPVAIPNVLGLQSQFLPLVKIWTECSEELRPLSRKLARGAEVNSRAAYDALPEDLRRETEHPDKESWDRAIKDYTDEDGFVLVPVSRLAEIQGLDARPRLTKKQGESLARTAMDLGFCVEPDARVTSRGYGWNDFVAVYRPTGDSRQLPESRYLPAAAILELGMAVAAADGVVTRDENARVGQFLEGQFLLNQEETRRLKQLERLLTLRPSSLAQVGKRLTNGLALEQRRSVGKFLVGVAAANGEINAPTLKALRGAFRAMSVDAAELNQLLEGLRSPADRKHEAGNAGSSQGNVALDPELLRRIMADTQAVGQMLGEVFRDETEESDPTNSALPSSASPATSPDPTPAFPGLPDRYVALFLRLRARGAWLRPEFEELVRSMGFMPADALSRINEWAEEHLGDSLIEEGDVMQVKPCPEAIQT